MINVCVKFGVTIFISTGFASIPFGGIEWYSVLAFAQIQPHLFVHALLTSDLQWVQFGFISLVNIKYHLSAYFKWIHFCCCCCWRKTQTQRSLCVVRFLPIFFAISLGYTYSVYLFLVIGWFLWCYLVHLDGVVDVLIVDALHRQQNELNSMQTELSTDKNNISDTTKLARSQCKWQFFEFFFWGVCTLYWCSISA